MISIVVAMDKNGLIGLQGKLPWRIKTEMKHFQRVTDGGVCIFGRKTWESINKPLPNRICYVVSKTIPRFGEEHYTNVTDNVYDALSQCYRYFPKSEIFICGGRSLYEQTLPFVDRVYLSLIDETYEGDTFFPCQPKELLEEMDFSTTYEAVGNHYDNPDEPIWDCYLLERHTVGLSSIFYH